jgi:hypothetical protein
MPSLRAGFPALLALAGAACHGGSAAPTTVEAPVGPWSIGPGQELTRCIVFHLDNPGPAFIRTIRAELGVHSHHMTIYRSADAEERLIPFDCRGFDSVLQGDRPLFIAQQERAEITFPDDDGGAAVGYAIDAHQMVRLEMHYLDTTPDPVTTSGRFSLETIPLSPSVVPADIAFWGTVGIHIPPHAAWETEVKFVEAPASYRTFALTTHQHRLGTRMRVWYADDAADTAGPPLTDSRSWSDPPLVVFSPPLRYGPAGKKGLAYQCDWSNTTADTVTYGEGFHDEMCFVWHYYFPGQGFDHIIQP